MAQPNRCPGRPLWLWPLAPAMVYAPAVVVALLILVFLRDGTDERPSADGRPLIVWVANNDRKGVAVAFNELKDAYRQNLEYHLKDGLGWREYDLCLMPCVNAVSDMPMEGGNLILVADVQNVLHFRIFADGQRVVDTDENRLPDQAQQIAALRSLLSTLRGVPQLSRSEKDSVITAVTSIVGDTCWRPSGQSEVLRDLLVGDKMKDVRLTWGGVGVRLMSSVNAVSDMPMEGGNLILVADVQNVLHFRIFADGQRVVDTDENRLPDQAQQIAALRSLLSTLRGVPQLSRSEKDSVITAVTSIVHHTPWGGGRPPTFAIEFRFIPNEGLLRNWRPLFHRLAGQLAQHPVGSPAGPVSPKEELSKDDRGWYCRMAKDVRDSSDRLLILGPDASDAVPALWFALCNMSPGSKAFPPTVSLAATSSLLDYKWDALADSGANGRQNMWSPNARPNWYTSLGRMMGYCEDDLRHATSREQEQIRAVVKAIRGPARSFIQFAASDRKLVETSFAYLHDVQGFQHIGVLYPVPSLSSSAGPVRLLYGPTLCEEYQSYAGGISVRDEQVILPVAYPNPPDSNWQDPKFLGKLADTLRPTLRFFRQSGVEAVGVFGSPDAKPVVLPLVRTELPEVQLFTSDATWQLESPVAPEATDRTGSGKGGGDAARSIGRTPSLDGLLVFTSSYPPRRWAEAQFVDFGPQVESGQPFLPDTFQFYTAHVVKRLIELVQQNRLDLLTRDQGVDELKRFLYSPTNIGPSDLRGGSAPVLVPNPQIETMLMREGKLGPLAELKDLFLSLGLLGLSLIVLASQYFHQARRRGGANSIAPEAGLVISPLFYVYQGVRSAAAIMREESRLEAPRVQADWRRLLGNELIFVSLLVTAFLLVVVGALAVAGWLGQPVSWSPWPDGHSVFPSVFLAAVAVVLAHHLPYRFEEELSRSGLVRDPRLRPQAMESWILRRWAPPFSPGELEARFDHCVKQWVENDVFPVLTLTSNEALSTAFAAAGFALLEVAAGMPVSYWWVSNLLLLLGEFVTAWVVVATAWTLYQLSGMPDKLRERLQNTEGLRLGQLDTSSVTRMGSIFIETIAYFLVVLGLLVVGRLPEYNMAHWSRFRVKGIPGGMLLVGLALAFIIWYWLYCYTTLKRLIRSVKMDRLDELESIRKAAFQTQPVPLLLRGRDRELASPKKKEEEDLQKVAGELEKQRRAVEEVSEEPWKASASWRAWFALGLLLLPSVLSALFGSWGETLWRSLRALAGTP